MKRNGACSLARSASRASFFGPIPRHRALAPRVPPDHATTSSRGPAGSPRCGRPRPPRTLRMISSSMSGLRLWAAVLAAISIRAVRGVRAPAGSPKTRLKADVTISTRHRATAPPRPALHALFPRLPIGPALVLACDKRDRPRAPGPPRLQYSTIPGVSAPWKGRPTRRRSTCMAARTV